MRKSNQQSIGQLLDLFVKENRLESGLLQVNLHQYWNEIAGEFIARHTTEIKIIKNTLFIRVDNAACREELLYRKSELLERVVRLTGAKNITEISIH